MKALILKTFPTEATGPVGDAMASSFRSHILRLEPDCEVDTCGLADDEAVPDPLSYDLVVFTGGTFDLLSPEPHPVWVARARWVVQAVAGDGQGKTKLLGICWGHQVIHLALDGQLGVLEEGPRIGVEQLQLTPDGAQFFGKESLRLHKFHKRQVKSPAEGFVALAPDNEILYSASHRLLSLQSHPELSSEISQGLLDGDTKGFYREKARPNPNVVVRDIHSEHDGAYVWAKILDWVRS
ncbi:glutamine amidotransferase class-I domain-containing protein [Purpureocillium lilacinum]|uniref:Glutamine amidotransferase class-I domain-containing protein n=1 Tax=Purpureocillium lilacinum TaxID=33203 RepID=A0A179GHR1_PURLI|nr:glutamine amidotransferase class-I domain-containing protein [Purpureocillium lilacinum]